MERSGRTEKNAYGTDEGCIPEEKVNQIKKKKKRMEKKIKIIRKKNKGIADIGGKGRGLGRVGSGKTNGEVTHQLMVGKVCNGWTASEDEDRDGNS